MLASLTIRIIRIYTGKLSDIQVVKQILHVLHEIGNIHRFCPKFRGNFYLCLQRNTLPRVILRNEVTKNLETSTLMYSDSLLTLRMTRYYIVFCRYQLHSYRGTEYQLVNPCTNLFFSARKCKLTLFVDYIQPYLYNRLTELNLIFILR